MVSINMSLKRDQLAKKFGVEIGGYRPGDTDGMSTGHGDGLTGPYGRWHKALGDDRSIRSANYKTLNVSYVIWQQRF